jgi:hypothetical protein
MKRILQILFVMTLLGVDVALAQTSVAAKVSSAEIYIGDEFLYSLTVRFPENSEAELPAVVGNLGSFEVRDIQVSELQTKEGISERTWTLKLSTFVSGDFVLPPQLAEIKSPGSDSAMVLRSEAIPLKVLSRTSEDQRDILDAELPADYNTPWPWLWILGAVITLLFIGWLTKMFWFKKSKSKVVPRLAPHPEALEALNELRAQNYLEQDRPREHFYRLTEILKVYIERRFEIDATDATGTELLARIEAAAILSEALFKEFKSFVKQTDLIKFADFKMDLENYIHLDQYVDGFLNITQPIEPSANEPGAETSARGDA